MRKMRGNLAPPSGIHKFRKAGFKIFRGGPEARLGEIIYVIIKTSYPPQGAENYYLPTYAGSG